MNTPKNGPTSLLGKIPKVISSLIAHVRDNIGAASHQVGYDDETDRAIRAALSNPISMESKILHLIAEIESIQPIIYYGDDDEEIVDDNAKFDRIMTYVSREFDYDTLKSANVDKIEVDRFSNVFKERYQEDLDIEALRKLLDYKYISIEKINFDSYPGTIMYWMSVTGSERKIPDPSNGVVVIFPGSIKK